MTDNDVTEQLRERALGKVGEVPARVEALLGDYAKALRKAGEIDVTRRGTDARDKARADARQSLDDGLAELRGRVDSDAGYVGGWITQQGRDRDVTEQLLAETRQGRAWARTAPLLDQGRDVASLVDAAREAGDHHTLSALRAELPAYLDARGGDPDAMLAAGGPDELPGLLRRVDEALADTLPDDHGEATALRTRLRLDDATGSARDTLDAADRTARAYADDPDVLDRALAVDEVETHAVTGGEAA